MERNGSWINWILFGNFVYQFTRWSSGQITLGQLLYRGIIKPILLIGLTLLFFTVVFVSCSGFNVKWNFSNYSQSVSESRQKSNITDGLNAMYNMQYEYTSSETDNAKAELLTGSTDTWHDKFTACGEKKDYKCQLDMIETRTALIKKMKAESTAIRK